MAVRTLPYWTLCIHPSSVILIFCSSIPKAFQTGKRTSSIFLISSLKCSSAPLPTPNPMGHSRLILGFTSSRSQGALLQAELGVFSGLPQHLVLVSFETHHWLFTSYLLHAGLETRSEQVTCCGRVPGCRTRQFSTRGRKHPLSAGPLPPLGCLYPSECGSASSQYLGSSRMYLFGAGVRRSDMYFYLLYA